MTLDLLILEEESKQLRLLCNGPDLIHSPLEDTVYRYVLVYLTQYGNLELTKTKALDDEQEGYIKKLDYMTGNVDRYFKAARKYIILNEKCSEFSKGEITKEGYFENFKEYKSKERDRLITYVEDCERLLKARGLMKDSEKK